MNLSAYLIFQSGLNLEFGECATKSKRWLGLPSIKTNKKKNRNENNNHSCGITIVKDVY